MLASPFLESSCARLVFQQTDEIHRHDPQDVSFRWKKNRAKKRLEEEMCAGKEGKGIFPISLQAKRSFDPSRFETFLIKMW